VQKTDEAMQVGAEEVSKLVQKTDEAMQVGAEEVSKLVQKTDEAMQVGAEEVSKLAEVATNQARVLGQDLETTAATLRPGLEKTAQAAERANKKASELAEQMQPKLLEAHEKAKEGLFKAASTAAATAIWFQSLSSAGMDSVFDPGPSEPACEVAGVVERQQPEPVPKACQMGAETAEEAVAGLSGFQFHPESRQIVALRSTTSSSSSSVEENAMGGGEITKSATVAATTMGADTTDSASVAQPEDGDIILVESSDLQESSIVLEPLTTEVATGDPAQETEALTEGFMVSLKEARADTHKDEDCTLLY